MAEAEDVIVDAARHVTSRAMALWQRHRSRTGDARSLPELTDVRRRLELLVEACTGCAVPIRTAMPQAPPTTLARLFRNDRRVRNALALPATDGTAIFLPARVDAACEQEALDFYRLSAIHQALRCLRGTAAACPHVQDRATQDLFLVSELLAVDRCMQRGMPGWRAALQTARRRAAMARPSLADLPGALKAVEALYQSVLADSAGEAPSRVPLAERPEMSLQWARAQAELVPRSRDRYRGLVQDAVLGEVVRPEAGASPLTGAHVDVDSKRAGTPRTGQMRRRPRVRSSEEAEDDGAAGVWMVQSSQPSEHAEDPMGLQRPEDQRRDMDLDGAAESVSELEEARLVSTPGTPRELLLSDDAPPRPGAAVAARPVPASATALAYPEWDGSRQAYLPRAAWVRMEEPMEGSADWVAQTLHRQRLTLQRIRRRFEALKARRSVEHRQADGDELDLEAFVEGVGDRRAKLPREDRLYLAHRPARLDVALLVLIDVSGSTDAWVSAGMRIVDVEKEALLIVSTALDALGLDGAIYGFSGHGPENVRMRPVKRFEERFTLAVQKRIAALEPGQYTRAGAAVRHASALLARRPRSRRLLLLLSDGKPNDCDRYEGRYGMEDFRQAIAEARLQGVAPYCITVDREAARHLPRIFGAREFSIVRQPQQLTGALLDWLRRAAIAAR